MGPLRKKVSREAPGSKKASSKMLVYTLSEENIHPVQFQAGRKSVGNREAECKDGLSTKQNRM